MSSRTLAATARQERSDPARIAPFLTHVVAHNGQLTLIPPQNAGRIRKGGKSGKNLERAKTERRRDGDEPRFNTAAPQSPRSSPRRGSTTTERSPRPATNMPSRFSRDTMIPEYPPPSFQEALMTPPFIPPPADTEQSQSPDTEQGGLPSQERGSESTTTSFPPNTNSRTITPPPASPPPLTVHTDITRPANPVSPPGRTDTSSASDRSSSDSSIELVNLETEDWDQERRLGVPLKSRVEREFHRLQVAESTTALVPRPPRLFERREDLVHDRCSHCGSPKGQECNAELPPTRSLNQSESSSPPSSPKGRKWKRLFIPTSTHATDDPPLSPTPSSPRSPKFGFLSAALSSTLTLPSHGSPGPSKPPTSQPSPHRKEGSVVRRLFSSKGKERESPVLVDKTDSKAGLDDWEVVDRGSDSEISPGNDQALSSASEGSDQSHANSRRQYDRDRPRPATRPIDAHSPGWAHTAPAFINRSVRPSPQNSSPFPMFGPNSSVVSLPLAGPSPHDSSQPLHSGSTSVDLLHEGQPSSPSLAPRRKAVSTLRASPSVVWLPLLKSSLEGDDQSSYSLPAVLPPSNPSPMLHRSVQELQMQGSHLTSTSRHMSTPVLTMLPAMHIMSSPSITDSSVQPYSYSVLRTPTLRSPASALTLNSSLEIPTTPSTPIRHYHGRPLPQPPGQQGSPGERLVLTPLATSSVLPHSAVPAAEYTPVTDLDLLAARVIENDHGDGSHYEDLLRISEIAGPAPTSEMPSVQLPPTGRVELKRRRVTKDGRVRLKMTLMDVVVDKCSICLSQFKEAEVACHGTNCRHAFHEYCLKRWLAKSHTCPLCRAIV